MLVPIPSKTCEVFGQNDTDSLASWADYQVDPEGDYAWTLWRPYRCCKRRGETLLFQLQWLTWPP